MPRLRHFFFYAGAIFEPPADQVGMTAQRIQKDQPPNYHIIARRAKPDVAIRFFPVPEGPGGACAAGVTDCHVASLLAMTAEDDGWSRFAGGAAVIPERTAERS